MRLLTLFLALLIAILPDGPLFSFPGIRIVESVNYSNIRSFRPSFARQWLACRSLRL